MTNHRDNDVTDVVFLNDDGNPYEDAPENRTGYDNKFDAFVSSTKNTAQATLTVYKYQGRTVSDGLSAIEKWPVDKFEDMESLTFYLRDVWGAGAYRVQVREKNKIVVNEHLEVMAPRKQSVSENVPRGDNQLTDVLRAVMEQNEKTQQMMVALMSRQNQPENNSRKEMLEEMVIYKQLFSGGSTTDATSGLKQLREVMEVAKDLGMTPQNAVENDDDGMLKLLGMAAPLFQAAAQAPQVAPQKTVPQLAAPQAPAQNPENLDALKKRKENEQMNLMLKMGLKTLMRAASHNSDPAMYAEMIVDQFGEEQAKNFLAADGALEKLLQLEPKATAFKEWFVDLSEHVKAMIGLPSKFENEYVDLNEEGENGIPASNELTNGADNATNLHTNGNTDGTGGGSGNPEIDVENNPPVQVNESDS